MIYILIALGVFLLDSGVKNYIEQNFRLGEKRDILKGKITIKKEYNSGFCMNLMDDNREFVKKVSAVIFGFVALLFILMLPRKRNCLRKLALALCVGGAASNLRDRLRNEKVLDYFSFNIKPIKHIVFNMADLFIMIGSLIMFASALFSHGKPAETAVQDEIAGILE